MTNTSLKTSRNLIMYTVPQRALDIPITNLFTLNGCYVHIMLTEGNIDEGETNYIRNFASYSTVLLSKDLDVFNLNDINNML